MRVSLPSPLENCGFRRRGEKKQSCPDLHPPHAFPLGEGGSAHRALTDEGENRIFANAYV